MIAEEAAALLAEARPELAAATERLGQAAAAACSAWPSVSVPTRALVDRLAGILPRTSDEATRVIGELALADLYLACGCLLRLPAALGIFDQQFLARVPTVVSAIDCSPAFGDDVRQELSRKLLVGQPPTPPALTRYAGRGPLHSFVAVAAQRTALDLLRARGRLVHPADEDELERRLGNATDLELEAVKAGLREPFGEALRLAIQALDARERMTLRLTLVSGLSLEAVGAVYGVNASTVCRWLARTRQRLALELRRHLSARLPLAAGELESVARLVQSRLDIGLPSLLGPSQTR